MQWVIADRNASGESSQDTALTSRKSAITGYRAFDLENDIAGGSHIEGFPIKAIPAQTKHDRGRSKVTAESNEE